MSDVLGGAAIGILSAIAIRAFMPSENIITKIEWLEEKHSGFFYSLAFILIFQFVLMFNDVRNIIRMFSHHL